MIKKSLIAQGLLLLLVGSPTTVNAQECGDSICGPVEDESTCSFDCIELLFAETGTSFTGVVVSLSSTEIVSVSLRDANAEYVDFAIVGTATSTILSLEGLFPNTSYFVYQDDFRTFQKIETDGAGAFSFVQDLAEYHQVFIKTQPSTIFISDDPTGGDCGLVGIWDAATKTCTLTQDLSETVQIDANGITLNCANHVISGTGGTIGILVFFTTGVTVQNCEVQNFGTGITIDSSISCHVCRNVRPFGTLRVAGEDKTLLPRISPLTALGGDLNRSMQHLHLIAVFLLQGTGVVGVEAARVIGVRRNSLDYF